jgi:hypothetical protein
VSYPLHISLADVGVWFACARSLFFSLRSTLLVFAGALCIGVTSESVCKLREMVVREVFHLWMLYPSILVVVAETEVPTTCLGGLVVSCLDSYLDSLLCL